jgi:hypothetical protein
VYGGGITRGPATPRVDRLAAEGTRTTSHTITAVIDVPRGGADGVLAAEGGVPGGHTLYIKDGKPIYEYNYFGHEQYKVAGADTLPPGAAVIRVDFKYDGGTSRFGAERFDVGMDSGSPVSERYQSPFAYVGTIKKVDIHIARSGLSASDQQRVRVVANKAAMAIE